ncbi:MAG: PDZ domain-containing protein [Proteobacteria bacterium]|nr:PDZ domain-containing protein [Pseudomonadota bacterium]
MKKNRWLLTLIVVQVLLLHSPLGFSAPSLDKSDHNFGEARVVDRVILSVIERYYDRERIDSQQMFRATMEALQKRLAEVTVAYDEEQKTATVGVLGHLTVIDMADLRSPWDLSRHIRRTFQFLYQYLPKEEYDLQLVEYAVANAMLATLDPHSNALPPDIYENLRMDTTGEFGGLGIRISTDRRPPCRGKLTVVDVFDGTPAKRAGLRPGDHIIRIGGDSTINITTAEAAERLRGTPGSKVNIKIRSQDGTMRFIDIRRETIAIESVQSEMLKGKVGYITLSAFQGNSAAEFKEALDELHEKGMKGLVFDLRGNPGGLLDVAIKIADFFLESGTIVATAGRNKDQQSVRNATANGTQGRYPIVVLIDANSASAAEIIAGALRNHGRVVLVGQTTFGKGSVQMVRPMPGGGALKLTSAQYLTPGDISIQAVGVAPDVSFRLYAVEKKDLDLGESRRSFSEADLSAHLDRPSTRTRKDRPSRIYGTLFIPQAERKADLAKYERCFMKEDRTPFRGRYEKEFARRLIANTDGTTAGELLVKAREMVEQDNQRQDKTMQKALKRLGVDWSKGRIAKPQPGGTEEKSKEKFDSRVTAKAKIVGPIIPGRAFKINVTVKNGTKKPIYRLQALTESDNNALDGFEFVFGKVGPGKQRGWSAVLELSPIASPRVDPVKIRFRRESGPLPGPIEVEGKVPEQKVPRLAYNWQFEDLGNSNGLAEIGEELLMHVTIKNVGTGATQDAAAELSAKPGVDVEQGRFDLGKLRPGETVKGYFKLKVSKHFTMEKAKINFFVEDWFPARMRTTRTLLNREIDLPVHASGPSAESASGSVTIKADRVAPLREAPSKDGRVVANAPSGVSFAIDYSFGDFFRVAIGAHRHAWIDAADVAPGGKPNPKYDVVFVMPPEIRIEGPRVRRVTTEKVQIQGYAEHSEHVRDFMVFVGDHKVMYLPNTDPASGERIAFKVDVPLEAGANHVMLVARYDDKVNSVLSIFVRRDPK